MQAAATLSSASECHSVCLKLRYEGLAIPEFSARVVFSSRSFYTRTNCTPERNHTNLNHSRPLIFRFLTTAVRVKMAEGVADSNFEIIWREAFRTYKEKTKRDLNSKSVIVELQNLHTIDDLNQKIGERYGSFEAFRNKHGALAARVQTCMKPVETLSGVISSAIAMTPYAPACAIFGAGMFLINVRAMSRPLVHRMQSNRLHSLLKAKVLLTTGSRLCSKY